MRRRQRLAEQFGRELSGGGPSSPPTKLVDVKVTVTVAAGGNQEVRPGYVSVNTKSLVIALSSVNGGGVTGVNPTTINTVAHARGCMEGAGQLVCTATASGSPGDDVFAVTTYAGTNASRSGSLGRQRAGEDRLKRRRADQQQGFAHAQRRDRFAQTLAFSRSRKTRRTRKGSRRARPPRCDGRADRRAQRFFGVRFRLISKEIPIRHLCCMRPASPAPPSRSPNRRPA